MRRYWKFNIKTIRIAKFIVRWEVMMERLGSSKFKKVSSLEKEYI